MMKSTSYVTERAPRPAGPYSQAVKRGNILALAGQVGIDPRTSELVEGIEAQARVALTNLGSVLAEAGASFDDLVMLRVYLTDTDDFSAMNAVLAEFVPETMPARTTVYVGLPAGMLIEIDALAVVE
jgi:reactive intermediate/imine deaminase